MPRWLHWGASPLEWGRLAVPGAAPAPELRRPARGAGSLMICLLMALLVAGCSSTPPAQNLSARPVAVGGATPLAAPALARDALHAQHREWAGAPYRLGGTSKAGVDCSGFVRQTFAQRFGLELPRTTEAQVQVGDVVERPHLVPGDLVFFQTGFRKLHVGIYVEEGRFLHASTSRGVKLSQLDNPYWREHYWHARRVRD